MSGQVVARFEISSISNEKKCQVTTTEDHGFSTGDFVRLTDLNGRIPIPRGQDQINNKRFKIYVNGSTSFLLIDPIRNKYVDSSNYTPYVEGGSVNLFQTDYDYEGDN